MTWRRGILLPGFKPWKAIALTFCDTNLQVAVTTQCTITVTAFQKSSDKEIAIASFTFTPPLKPVGQVPMVQAVLPSSFNKVYKIAVVQNNPATQSLGIDNLVYTVSK